MIYVFRKKDAGTNAEFSEIFTIDQIESDLIIKGLPISVEVLNQSVTGSSTHIGEGMMTISDILTSSNNTETPDNSYTATATINLDHHKKGSNDIHQGKVTFQLLLTKIAAVKPVLKLSLPAYTMKISDIRAIDLVNTGNLLDKQDPSVSLKIGDKYNFKTER